ncbi:hypothetical protein Tco_1460659 [Tanacetum coccineum]
MVSLEKDLKQTKQGRTSVDTEILLDQEEPIELVGDLGSGEKDEKEISTANISVSTASATPEVSTAAENLVYIRRSAEKRKDKGKAIMKEDESVQKKAKKQLEQERLGHEEAIRLQEQINEEEKQRIARDAEIAKQLQEEFDRARQEQEVVAEADQAHDIDWSDPAVLRYHALQNRSFSVAEVRKNMCMYLKNQGGYKQSHFKGMSYEDIRPIFERKNEKIESKQVEEEIVQQEDVVAKQVMIESSKKAGGRLKRKVSNARKDKDKRQKMQDDPEKLTLKEYVEVISNSEEVISVITLAVKSLIVSWKSYCKGDVGYYKIHRADGSYKTYCSIHDIITQAIDDGLAT